MARTRRVIEIVYTASDEEQEDEDQQRKVDRA